jgi:phosphoribosylaminoimidazole-succinocarboxamide synthase
MQTQKLEMLYEGKAKRIYRTSEENHFWVEYKDSATAFNGEKKGTITGKGELNNKISGILFDLLREKGVENHYVKELSDHEQLVKGVTIVPIEVVVRNVAAGSLAKRLGWEEGTILPETVVEFYYKNDALGDPLVNRSHISVLKLAKPEQLVQMEAISRQVNEILTAYFKERDILLIDFKLEFGTDVDGVLMLADEISPDTCRFWDANTKERLDKDRFRRDLGQVEEAYQEIYRRIGGTKHV